MLKEGPGPEIFPGTRGRSAVRRYMEFLEGLEPGGDFAIDAAIEDVLQRRRGRGCRGCDLGLPDLWRCRSGIQTCCNGSGLEIFAIQILSPSEINPEYAGGFSIC